MKRVVSIHAQRGGWAKPAAFWVAPSSWLFQSTPSAVAGRNVVRPARKSERLGFNPRPARWLGETPGDCASHARCLGFNPRPARWLGETADLIAAFAAHRVSIHAQRGGWAKRSAAGDSRETDMFQSTPSAVAGRNRAARGRVMSRDCVSIHAQRGGWAKRCHWSPEKPLRSFQSTPSAVAGRNLCACSAATSRKSFQSTPSAVAGRNTRPSTTASPACWFQSTPSAVAGRNHAAVWVGIHTRRFNPRPARWLGETGAGHQAVPDYRVSIHAQRGGWAKPRRSAVACCARRFQSTPSAVAGRNDRQADGTYRIACFNPRPARWLGETVGRADLRRQPDVSIHAQRGGWAKLADAAVVSAIRRLFQSTPSAVAGRNMCGASFSEDRIMFQSTPSAVAGRNTG